MKLQKLKRYLAFLMAMTVGATGVVPHKGMEPVEVMAAEADERTEENFVTNGNFEDGFTGWTLMDGTQVTEDNNQVGVVSSEATYWGNRAICQLGESYLRGDSKEGEAGVIRSSEFVLGGDGYISFMIGAAGAEGKGCVRLYQKNEEGEDTLVKTYVNEKWNDPKTGLTLLRKFDQLDEAYMGKTLYFVVENGSEPGFSFINVDDFRTSMTKEEVIALQDSQLTDLDSIEDTYKDDIIASYRAYGLINTEVSVVSCPETIKKYTGNTVNLVEVIRDNTVVETNYTKEPVAYEIKNASFLSNSETLHENDGNFTMEKGDYKISYTLSYTDLEGVQQNVEKEANLSVEDLVITEKVVNGNFETGDYTGWTYMDGKPLDKNNSVGMISNENTYWGEQNRAIAKEGEYCLRGDGKEGEAGQIRSSSFILGGDGYISFMIGAAGAEGKGCVRLYQENEGGEDTLVKTYINERWNDPKTALTLIRKFDKLDDAYMGKTLYFVVENGSEAGFSFINVDDFRTSMTRDEVIALQNSQLEDLNGIEDTHKAYIIESYKKNGIINDVVLKKACDTKVEKFAGMTIDVADMIARLTRAEKSYTGERVEAEIAVSSVTLNGSTISDDLSQLRLVQGDYEVTYRLKYGETTENEDRTVTISVKDIDAAVNNVENGGFETGDLTGWEVLGEDGIWSKNEDGNYKGVRSAETYWGENLTHNQEGSYHLNGWEVTDNEKAAWGVRSSVFTLGGSGWISLRMGGNSAQVKVYRYDGTLLGIYDEKRFSDTNFPFINEGGSWADMGTYFIDLSKYKGEALYLELWDAKITGGWANAFFDAVNCYYEDVPDVANGYDTVTAPARRDETGALVYDEVKIPWTELKYYEESVKLAFDDTGFEVKNLGGKQETAHYHSVFENPKYQDEPVQPYRPDGISGKALNFDGYSNYIAYDEKVSGEKLTIDAYVCPRVFMWEAPATSKEERIAQVIAGSYNTGAKAGFMLGVTKHGYLTFGAGTGDQWYSLSSEDGKQLKTYEWNRVTAVFDGNAGKMTIYLNGEKVGEKKIQKGDMIAASDREIRIGKGSEENIIADNLFDGTMFCGLMDEVSIASTAMTATEVKEAGKALPKIAYKDAMTPDSALTNDYYRPSYHAVPAGNWMNEPHALFQYNGKWHLFYQFNPSGPYWHNISWGHWVSDDMVNWKFVKEAVIPTEGTISPDGVWTGNVIYSADGEPMLLITAGDDSRPVNGSNQHVGLVKATNYNDPSLTNWEIVGYAMAQTSEMGTPGEFRDAQAFGIGNDRYMLVGGANNGQGVAHVFKTTAKTTAEWEAACKDGNMNGMNWEYKGDLFGDFFKENPYLADYGKVWEMPNLVPLNYEDGTASGKYLFVFSPQHGDNDVWYYIGEFDTESCRFVPDFKEAKLMDYGNNIFTGPTVYTNPKDGKVYICSVMQDNSVGQETQREIAEHYNAGWAFYAGLPRELYLQADGKSLGIKHIDTSTVEGKKLISFENLSVEEANEALKAVNSDTIKIDFELTGIDQSAGFLLKKSENGSSRLFFDKTAIGLDGASGDYTIDDSVKGTIYVDKCSIEAYIDNQITLSGSKYFLGKGLEVFGSDSVKVTATVTAMNSIHTQNVAADEFVENRPNGGSGSGNGSGIGGGAGSSSGNSAGQQTSNSDSGNVTIGDEKVPLAPDATEQKVEKTEIVNEKGNTVEVTTTTTTDADGNVIGITQKSVIANVEKNATATVTVTTDANGKVTATASVSKVAADQKLTINGATIAQIVEAAGQNTTITLAAKNEAGKTLYKVKVNSADVKAGKKLTIYKKDAKTGELVLVNTKQYKVSAKGNVNVEMSASGTYQLVSAAEAKKMNKQILATIAPAQSKANVKPGKSVSFKMSSKLNAKNVKSVTYKTSNAKVAKVTNKGTIQTKKKGLVTVKAIVTLKNGQKKTVKMKVTVKV